MNNNFDKKVLPEHKTIETMISLSLLIYEFNNKLKIENKTNKDYNLDTLKFPDDSRKNLKQRILNNMLIDSSLCELHRFYDEINGTQVGITINHKEKRIILVFRGSDELKDWLKNILFCKKQMPKIDENIYIHVGFYRCLFYNKLYNRLVAEINNLYLHNKDYDLYITGHSLGGALATLFGYFLSYNNTFNNNKNNNGNINVVSFASPRLGNKKWVNDFNNRKNIKHIRIVNNHDIVTSIPYVNYFHCGNKLVLKNKKIEYNEYNKYNKYNKLKKISLLQRPSIKAHDINKYYTNIMKCKNIWYNNAKIRI